MTRGAVRPNNAAKSSGPSAGSFLSAVFVQSAGSRILPGMGTPNSRSTEPDLFMKRFILTIGNVSFLRYHHHILVMFALTHCKQTRCTSVPPFRALQTPTACQIEIIGLSVPGSAWDRTALQALPAVRAMRRARDARHSLVAV